MTSKYYGLTAKDLKGLPDEVLKQLKISKSLTQSMRILKVVKSLGGYADIDKIIIEYFKQHNEVCDRIKLNAKLYRMKNQGLLESVDGQKGVYSVKGDVDDV